MGIRSLKLENKEYHDYFVQTVYNIISNLNFKYTFEEIEEMCINNSYYLHFHNRKTKKWHLGIWAVGEWGIKEEVNGNIIKCGYGVDVYKPLTICVFLVHDWTFDKFRPTYADWEVSIQQGTEINSLIGELKYFFKHPLESYYILVDEDSYNCQHKENNKYIAYFKGWYHNDFLSSLRKLQQRIFGYILTKIIMFISLFDRRVYYRESKFHKDRWNAEYEIAIVFKYGETEWHDWKRWNDYEKIFRKFQKLCDYNLEVEFTYLDADGNLPKNIWRGVYWEDEPEQ